MVNKNEKRKEWLVGLARGIFLILLIVVGIFLTLAFGGLTGFIVIVLWLLLSIKFLRENEMAILVIFGIPLKFQDSGPHFVPLLPFCYLTKRTKKMFNLDYPARRVVTREGLYKSRKDAEPKKYGKQVLTVDAVAYMNFPPDDNLIKIVQNKVPYRDEELKTWSGDSVDGALRIAFGNITWAEATEKISPLVTRADKVFTAEDGALRKAGFRKEDLKLTITEVVLPEKLAAALLIPDQERLKREAADAVAKRQAIEWVGMVLETIALARGKTLEQVQAEIDKDKKMQREFLDYAKDANIRLEEADRKALVHVIVGSGGKPTGGEGFLDALINGVVTIIAAGKMIPTGKKTPSEEKPKEGKSPEEWTDEEALSEYDKVKKRISVR